MHGNVGNRFLNTFEVLTFAILRNVGKLLFRFVKNDKRKFNSLASLVIHNYICSIQFTLRWPSFYLYKTKRKQHFNLMSYCLEFLKSINFSPPANLTALYICITDV